MSGKNECPIFGRPKDLSCKVLPTINDAVRCLFFIKNKMEQDGENRNEIGRLSVKAVAKQIQEIWTKLSIPIISHQRVKFHILHTQNKRQVLNKSFKRTKESAAFNEKLEHFLEETNVIFPVFISTAEKMPHIL